MSFLDETGYRHLYQKIVNKVQALWQKVGTATLTTNAKNTSEAINELKGTLVDTAKWFELLGSTNTTGSKTLSDDYTKYKTVMVVLFLSGSKIISQCYPTNHLLGAGYKAYVQSGSDAVLLTFSSATTVNIEAISQNIRIYGQK